MRQNTSSALSISVITREQEFHELGSSWNELASCAGGSIFLQHEWFDAAWEWRKETTSLFVLIVRDAERLIGILPLIKVTERRRFAAIRRLEFLTVPDTQLCDLIVAPEYADRVARLMCEELQRRCGDWDQIDLRYLPAAAAAQALTNCLHETGYTAQLKSHSRNLFVPLESSWQTYYSTRTRSLKKANNLAANRLAKTGSISIECLTHETATADQVRQALEHAVDISRRSWKHDTGNSLDHAAPNRFIRTLTAHALRRGWLALWLLTLDGRPIALEYQLTDGSDIYALRADFDSEFEEISPGSHLMRTLLESLFDKGLHRYYMGPGENAYKTRWTDEFEPLSMLTVYGTTARARVLRFVDEVAKPYARSLRDSWTRKGATAETPTK